jgi:type II secretory pathway pseudopilin PulG
MRGKLFNFRSSATSGCAHACSLVASLHLPHDNKSAYTIMELSLVVLIISLLTAAGLKYNAAVSDPNNIIQTNENFDYVENAIMNYRINFGRLPCPADITNETESSFGSEVGTAGDGNCTGANFTNATTDPDNADGLYDATTASQIVAGALPTRTLQIEQKYAFDAWNKKILYVVDKRMTATSAFLKYPLNNNVVGGIVIKNANAATLANSINYKGVYALISHGKNGHGAYLNNKGGTAERYNAASTNTDELKNCHCTNAAVAVSFDRIFVQKTKTGSSTLTDKFDDIVRFKTRPQIATTLESK